MADWRKRCYSRLLIDNHISEDAPSLLGNFDPEQYVARVKKAGVRSAMVYAVCHNGNSYYPTRVGHMHANLKGRDIFGETVALLRREGIVPVAYYTSVFHNHAAKQHPAWRITAADGRQNDGRYWWCCPNNDEYVSFALSQAAEVAAYEVAGMFNDMVFWPRVCFCGSCRTKYLRQSGREIPLRVDWADTDWVRFQRFREQSMAEYAGKFTDAVKSVRNITVTHQTATLMNGWVQGYNLGIAAASDYASGDFYGGKSQQILGAKTLAAVSAEMPYEFMTSRCVSLQDHTSMKSEAELTVEAATTLANGGAYFFIDAINPDGTLEAAVYERLGSVTKRLAPFTEALTRHTPHIVADTALYYSPASYVNEREYTGVMSGLPDSIPAVQEAMGTASCLTRAHFPFKVVCGQSLSWDGVRTLVLNDLAFLSAQEVARVRQFVADGGTLLATGRTSLYQPDGSTSGDFALCDVFGVAYEGGMTARFHYLSFLDRPWLVAVDAPGARVRNAGAKMLAQITEPLFSPDDKRYAAIHSHPPGKDTGQPGLTVHPFGKGTCIYLASPVLALRQAAQQSFGEWLFTEYARSSLVLGTNAPACVEITVLADAAAHTFLVAMVNYQRDLPNVPARDVYVTIRLPGGFPSRCVRISDGQELPLMPDANGAIRLETPLLETIEMFECVVGPVNNG